MIRTYERIKDGESCGVSNDPVSIDSAVSEIVNSELAWGAKVEWVSPNTVEFRTKVFGCLDITKYSCDEAEATLIRQVINGYHEAQRRGVNNVLLDHIGIKNRNSNHRYIFDDILVLFNLFLEGHAASKLELLLAPIMEPMPDPSQVCHIPMPVSPQLQEVVGQLDHDDGVRKIYAQAQLGLLIRDEVHHPK